MKMDIVMKLNFDDLEDVVRVDSTEQPTMYESDVLNMSGVVYDVIASYTNLNTTSPVSCNKMDTSVNMSPTPRINSPLEKVRSLRLFNSPATPKTLYEKCAADSTSGAIRTRSRRSRCRFKNSCPLKESPPSATKRRQSQTSNINPFTPTSMLLNKKRNTRRELEKNFKSSETPLLTNSANPPIVMDDSSVAVDTSFEEDELRQVTKLSLREANVTRYRQEFLEFSLVGKGQFGGVYKCKHRLDGCIYAIKKSLKPIAGSVCERTALNEVYAHAVLGKHPHVVRYYSAWAEESHMLIQNEYCNGGSLASYIRQSLQNKESICEDDLRQILLHVAKGLKYIHSLQLVHMDIKPENIFIVKEPKLNQQSDESADDGFEEDMQNTFGDDNVQYKIGDLGHVTSIINPQVEEGDCRYLPREILREDFSQLQKGDIFALGLTLYEAASGLSLPQNGDEWHFLRDGNMKQLSNIGSDFQMLLKMMIHPNPLERPTAAQVVQQLTTVDTAVSKSHQLLRRELEAEKMKNELLSKQLNEATKCLKTIKNSPTLSLNAAIASGVLAGVSSSPIRSRMYSSRTRNTRSGCCRYNVNY